MPIAVRQGHSIHYETTGPDDAPVLLLIMGLGLSSQAWDTLPLRLADRFRVITFDNRGVGRSGPLGRGVRMRDFADDARAVLEAAGASGGAFVFGISMGGMIAQELTLRHPQLVRSLCLGATFASWARSRKPAPWVALSLLAVSLGGSRSAHRLADILVGPQFDRDAFVRWVGAARLGVRLAVLRQMQAIVAHSTLSRLGAIVAPTLLVTGSADRLVPPANSRRLAERIRGARLVEIAGAGHVFPLEREDETVRLLVDHFLGG